MTHPGWQERWPIALISAALFIFAAGQLSAYGRGATTAATLIHPESWAMLTVVVAAASAWVWLRNGAASTSIAFSSAMVLFVGRTVDFVIAGQPSAAAINLVAATLALALWVNVLRLLRLGRG